METHTNIPAPGLIDRMRAHGISGRAVARAYAEINGCTLEGARTVVRACKRAQLPTATPMAIARVHAVIDRLVEQ